MNGSLQDRTPTIGYAFPPFCMIGRCLAKITSEKPPLDNPYNSSLEITSLVPSHLANVSGDTVTTPKSEEKTNRLTGE